MRGIPVFCVHFELLVAILFVLCGFRIWFDFAGAGFDASVRVCELAGHEVERQSDGVMAVRDHISGQAPKPPPSLPQGVGERVCSSPHAR